MDNETRRNRAITALEAYSEEDVRRVAWLSLAD